MAVTQIVWPKKNAANDIYNHTLNTVTACILCRKVSSLVVSGSEGWRGFRETFIILPNIKKKRTPTQTNQWTLLHVPKLNFHLKALAHKSHECREWWVFYFLTLHTSLPYYIHPLYLWQTLQESSVQVAFSRARFQFQQRKKKRFQSTLHYVTV